MWSRPGPVQATSWAEAGTLPDLNPGRWVIIGGPNKWNFFRTGLPGGRFNPIPRPPLLTRVPSNVPFTNSITGLVDKSRLTWPTGLDIIKGILGQRKIIG